MAKADELGGNGSGNGASKTGQASISGSASRAPSGGSSRSAPSSRLSSLFSSLSPADCHVAFQAAASALVGRYNLAWQAGFNSYDGLRDLFVALGFNQTLTIDDYRKRYQRGGIAKKLIDCLPDEMWDDGVFILEEDSNPANPTEFESASEQLWKRLDIESRLMKADKLAGLFTHSVLLIGVKESGNDLSTPLPRLSGPDSVLYLLQYAADNAKVLSLVSNPSDPRFSKPEYYDINTIGGVNGATLLPSQAAKTTLRVHWSRIIHVAHGLLESDWSGTPDLQASWNDLESLYKISWGGAEAAWRNMDKGMHWDLDPEYEHTPELLERMDEQIEEMRHNLRRDIKTSGVKANSLNNQVDKYASNAETQIKLVAGTHGIPYTLLLGEELGLRAGEQNRENLNVLSASRRKQFGTPLVRQLIDRLIEYGGLPTPSSGNYQVVWGVEEELNESEKAALAKTYAEANQSHALAGGGILYLTNEIRDKVGDDPIEEEELIEEDQEEVEEETEEQEEITDPDPLDEVVLT